MSLKWVWKKTKKRYFSFIFWSLSRKNEICSLMRRSQSISRLCKARSLSKVTALLRLEFWWFWIQIFIKQIWVAATEICLSQDKVSAWIGRSPMVLKNPGWDICSCYPDLGSFLLRFISAYGMFRIDFSGKLVIYWISINRIIPSILAGNELSINLKVMTSPFLTTTLSGIGRCTLNQIGKP